MLALYSSLLSLAWSAISWPSGLGLAAGFVLGAALAYGLVDRVLRLLIATPQAGLPRRLAVVGFLVWGLVLPLFTGAAGLVWGAGRGTANLVEGPVSATVRETVHVSAAAANGLGASLLKRAPLAKRLSERELLTVVQAAPAWIGAALDTDRVQALWQKTTGTTLPAQLLPMLQNELHALLGDHGGWVDNALEGLRARAAQGDANKWPTVQEAIEATVGPPVFHRAGAAIRARTRRVAALLLFPAWALCALLAVGLRLSWQRPARVASAVVAPPVASKQDSST